jgi:hypothetical protein
MKKNPSSEQAGRLDNTPKWDVIQVCIITCSARMNDEDLLPSKVDAKVLEFCRCICPDGPPFYVPARPEPGFEPWQCFPNVAKKVEMAGGKVVYGWEISRVPKVHLEAMFHAIWQAPTRKHVDVTPSWPESIVRVHILFLPDAHRRYSGQEVPSRRVSIGADDTLVQLYWSLGDELKALTDSVALGGVREDHPAVQSQRVALTERMKTVREKLQKA